MGSLEDAQDLMGEISIEDKTKNLPKAARAIEFESTGGRNKLTKKTKGHVEAQRNLRRKDGDELKLANKELTKQRRRYKARRIMQEMQKVKNKPFVCQALYCKEEEGHATTDRQKWKEELGRYLRKKYQDEEMRKKARKELDE